MKINLTSIFGFVIIVLLGIIFLQKDTQPRKEIHIPVTIPSQHGVIHAPREAISSKEYTYLPVTKEVDTSLLNKYRSENDSLKKELMYLEAITLNEYVETFEDESITVDVKVKTRGTLLGLSIPSYTINEKDYTIPYTPPKNIGLYIGGELGVPTYPNTPYILKANLMLDRGNLRYTVGYDTDRRVWGGLSFKLL